MTEEHQLALNAMEQRALATNARLSGLRAALLAGNIDRALSIWALIQESNWTQRKALIEAGAVDSIEAERSPLSSRVWDDDEEPVQAEKLDLAALRSEFGAVE